MIIKSGLGLIWNDLKEFTELQFNTANWISLISSAFLHYK